MSTVVESYRGNMRLLETFSSGPGSRKHGEVYAYHPNGTRAMSGSYLHGKPNGIWKRWYDSGILASVHNYAFGALNGPYVQYFDNGNKAREGLYRRGIPDGTHRIYYRDNQAEQSLFTIVDSKLTRFRVMLKGVELLYDEDLGLTQNGSTLRPTKVCFLRGNGTLVCKTLGQMVADLSTVINPENLADIISALDSLYDVADLGLDPGNDILVGCADVSIRKSCGYR